MALRALETTQSDLSRQVRGWILALMAPSFSERLHPAAPRFPEQFPGQSASGPVPRSKATRASRIVNCRARPSATAAGMSKQEVADWNALTFPQQ